MRRAFTLIELLVVIAII
ncbi:MAG: prepilin-type N-terminal cleavage/methylation domain-containing protein, partial [Phycisphaerae bacterium]